MKRYIFQINIKIYRDEKLYETEERYFLSNKKAKQFLEGLSNEWSFTVQGSDSGFICNDRFSGDITTHCKRETILKKIEIG